MEILQQFKLYAKGENYQINCEPVKVNVTDMSEIPAYGGKCKRHISGALKAPGSGLAVAKDSSLDNSLR